MTRRWLLVVLVVLGVVATPSVASPTQGLTLSVLSNTRADLVSDGQALVGISVPSTSGLTVKVGSRDVTHLFRRAHGRVEGIVDRLRVGTNVVTAKAHGSTARLIITNHPNGGPIFGGPQVQPWRCRAGLAGRAVQPAAAVLLLLQVDRSHDRPGCGSTTRSTRRPTSRWRTPRAVMRRSSCGRSSATSRATSTRS